MTRPGFPPRVLMTTDTVGGVWHYALELCRGLRPHGIDVLLATLGPRPSDDQRAAAAALGNVQLRESDYRLEWMDSPWADLEAAGEWLLGLEWEFAPDLVHLNGYAHGALPWRAPHVVVAHSCVLSWWQAVHGEPAPPAWDRYREVVSRGLGATEIVIAPTRAMRDALARHYGAAHAGVIPNGREPAEFARGSAKQPIVLSAGRLWDEAKNTTALATAAAQLAWPVWVVGDTSAPGETARTFPNVSLLGRRSAEQVARLHAQAAIYALPARYEPFGLSILEAGLAGCALVLGDIPSLRELWDGAADFVVPDDTDALRAALAGLIADPVRRQRQAAHARLRAARYSATRMVARYLELYRRLGTRNVPAAAALPSA